MTQLGPVSTMVAQDGRFSLVDHREGKVFVGATCESNIGRLLGWAVSPQMLFSLFTAEPPAIDPSQTQSACEDGSASMTRTTDDGGMQTIRYEMKTVGERTVLLVKSIDNFDANRKKRGPFSTATTGECRIDGCRRC
ncbi:MAG: hypothetical protein R3A47_02920 [Polyangiales bacterium]